MTEGRRRRTGWFGAIGVLAVAVLILGAGIGGLWRGWQPEVTGRAVPAETILGTDGSPAPLAIRHVGEATSFSTSDDAVVAGVLADLGTFWSRTLPADFGKPFVPLTGGYSSIDATARSVSSRCVSTPDQIAGNAYYCPDGDSIVWDSAGLVPVLLGHYGAAGLRRHSRTSSAMPSRPGSARRLPNAPPIRRSMQALSSRPRATVSRAPSWPGPCRERPSMSACRSRRWCER